MQRGNQRLPMLSIQNKNENSNINKLKNKSQDQNMMVVDDVKNNISNFKPVNREEKISSNIELTEKQLADGEFLKNVQKALQNAINENEELREKIKLLIKENSDLKDEIEDKNFALVELAQFYEFCQKNHKGSNDQRGGSHDGKLKTKNKRKSKSL